MSEEQTSPEPRLWHHFDDLNAQKRALNLGMWLFLASEVLLFAGLFAIYISYRFLHGAEFSQAMSNNNALFGTTNTMILLVSSGTMAISIVMVTANRKTAALVSLLLTAALGATFLVIKFIEYGDHFALRRPVGIRLARSSSRHPPGKAQGGRIVILRNGRATQPGGVNRRRDGKIILIGLLSIYPGTAYHYDELPNHGAELFFTLYFLMTGLHAVHLVIGILLVGLMAWRVKRGHERPSVPTIMSWSAESSVSSVRVVPLRP